MKTSPAGIAFIKSVESLRLKAYQDSGGVWTAGYGHTRDVKKGDTITLPTAERWLRGDLASAELDVTRLVTVHLAQHEYNALVSFAYNVGTDIDADTKAEGLGASTQLRKLNDSDYNGAAAEFQKWNKDNGKIVSGLTRRRAAESALFEAS